MKVEEAISRVEIAFGYSTAIHDDWRSDDEAEKIAIEAMKKQIPMKPNVKITEIRGVQHTCKSCCAFVGYLHEYCCECGQKLDWED